MSVQPAPISVVLPTFNRAEALRVTLPDLLALDGVSEIVVVDDASTDATSAVIEAAGDARLRVVRHQVRRGVPAARNSGVRVAQGDWVLFGEDDCSLPKDYALTLLSEARRLDADVVSAPWLNVPTIDDRESALARGRAAAVERVGLTTHPSTFPRVAVETPFLPACALIRRTVFETVGFHEGFRANAYREETDFFVSAMRRGHRCLLIPSTASFQAGHWPGGNGRRTSTRLVYEFWVWRNNRLFLSRHGGWLRGRGYIRSRTETELAHVGVRARSLVRERLRVLRGGSA